MSPEDISAYLHILVQNSVRPASMLHLVAPTGEERDGIVEAFVKDADGGLVIEATGGEVPRPLPLDMILESLQASRVLVLVADEGAGPLFPGFEEVRQEILAQGALLLLVSSSEHDLERLWMEAEGWEVIRAVLGTTDLRAATLLDWRRAQLSIPRDGSRPRLLAREKRLAGATKAVLDQFLSGE